MYRSFHLQPSGAPMVAGASAGRPDRFKCNGGAVPVSRGWRGPLGRPADAAQRGRHAGPRHDAAGHDAYVFADLLAHPGVEERCELRSSFGFMALHGGLEQATAELATDAAERAGASLYTVVQPDDLRWHVPSYRYDPACSDPLASFLDHVDVVVSVHGYGGLRGSDDRWTTVLVGGQNRTLAARLAADLTAALPHYTWLADLDRIPSHLRGVHPDNPVNRPRFAGVQLELPPRARGFGRYWDERRPEIGPGWPPHPAAIIDVLARLAGIKLEYLDIKNLDCR
jgi:phage replication-related protein YjqB (UPF0714/DUF867 family)